MRHFTAVFVISVGFLLNTAHAYRIIGPWKPIFKGAEIAYASTDTPRLQKVTAIRIDLWDTDLSFTGTPSNGAALGDTNRQTGTTFMTSSGCDIGVNAHYYISDETIDWNADLQGLHMVSGAIVSDPTDEWPVKEGALLITPSNVATIKKSRVGDSLSAYWTAIETRDAFILKNGVFYNYDNVTIHPRTGVGMTQDGRYLIFFTIDGRQTGYSEGCTFIEECEWMVDFGCYNGLNLDGGGSTHMLISNPSGPITVNSPSENRAVGSHIGAYVADLPQGSSLVYADFEGGVESPFTTSPTYSGTTYGIKTNSTANADSTTRYAGSWSQKLTFNDDTGVSGGWLVRHLAGSGTPSNNTSRPCSGWIGFFAKTSTAGLQAAVALDESSSVTERSDFVSLTADGQWHLYEWNIDDNQSWNAWTGGNGIIDTANFTVDSIQFTGPDTNAVIYIDHVMHNSTTSLSGMFDLPVTDGLIIHLQADVLSLANGEQVKEWPDTAIADSVDGTLYTYPSIGIPTFKTNARNGLPAVHFDNAAKQALISDLWSWNQTQGVTVFMVSTGGMPEPDCAAFIGDMDGQDYKGFGLDVGSSDTYGSGVRFNNGSCLTSGASDNPIHHGVWNSTVRRIAQGGTYGSLVYAAHKFPAAAVTTDQPSMTLNFNASNNVLALGNARSYGVWVGGSIWYNGDIAEVLVYNKQLTEAQMQSVLDYLNNKYDMYFSPADFQFDLNTDISDFAVLASQWLAQGSGLTADIYPPAGDGKVDLADFAEFARYWMSVSQ